MNEYNYNFLRQKFLDFFRDKGHSIVPSSPLIPHNDATLLFTNAGMVQFKDVFLGLDKRPYTRATTSQRCVRAGGKHNDLENVGYTARHHTFFEMLGNFSFGDYFKREAIQYAWEFLTQVLGLPPEKLWITVFKDDDEAADIWLKEIGINPTRFSRCGEADNFWSMGDTGPCGPCSEIFYDHGPNIAGGPPGSPDADGDRYVEIWNLVFMQYDRSPDGQLTKLPHPSVDTGMGLERLASVMQGVHNNYDTDLFQNLIHAIAELAKMKDRSHTSLKVIADHIRSSAFLITDGIIPSNEGRGYVLRRIIRRAIRHGHQLGLNEPFFYRLVKPLADQMQSAYPELANEQAHIEATLLQEEEQFAKTLDQGLKILEQDIATLSNKTIPGATLFRLYDTFGFPIDLTADIARERGLEIDLAGFEQEMDKQRQQSQSASTFSSSLLYAVPPDAKTEFTGYEDLEHPASVVTAIFAGNQPAHSLEIGQTGTVILDRSPFYAESGGQIGDKGMLYWQNGEFEVEDTRQIGQAYLHYGRLRTGSLQLNAIVHAQVDAGRRAATRLNHSATHLLHAALRQILGTHVTQKGSLVEPERLRFDFTHSKPLTPDQITIIERLVNQTIRDNLPVNTEIMSIEEALKSSALALFGEKYGDEVRVLKMGNFSTELCGGTHVNRTGDIGVFKITSESGVAAGIRRIEGVTGETALLWLENQIQTAQEKSAQLAEQTTQLEKQLEQYKMKAASSDSNQLAAQAVDIKGISVLITTLPNTEIKILRHLLDGLKQKLPSAIIVLASISDGRAQLVTGVTPDCVTRVSAVNIAQHIAEQIGGKGGGRPDMAQAGGTNPDALPAALKTTFEWIQKTLN